LSKFDVVNADVEPVCSHQNLVRQTRRRKHGSEMTNISLNSDC